MSDLSQIMKLIEDGNTTFTDFKNAMSARLDHVENIEAKGRRLTIGTGAGTEEDKQEMKSFRDFVRTGQMEAKAMTTTGSSGADGGYAVPKQIDVMIENMLLNMSPIRQIAQVRQTSTGDYHHLVNLRGTASGWLGETAARGATATPQLADVKPTMGDLFAFPQASQWMADDAYFDLPTWLAQQVSDEFARAEGSAFVSGAGINQPTGFLAGTLSAVNDNAGTRPFGTLQYLPTGVAGGWPASNPTDFLLKMIFELKAGFRQNGSWVLSKSVLSQIAQFKDSSGRYILTPMTSPTVPQMLFGFPVVEAEDMPPIAANALSIAFGDFKRGYLISDRIGMRVVRDELTNKPYIGLYCVKRTGGILLNSEAIKVAKFAVS
ncbi:MAG: phage major capsid protein [Burkholderiaceae bacterium]